jgi:hypothetical protein
VRRTGLAAAAWTAGRVRSWADSQSRSHLASTAVPRSYARAISLMLMKGCRSWSSARVDVDAGRMQGHHFVGQPVTASGFGHGAEPSGAGLVDGEQGWTHLVVAPNFPLGVSRSGIVAGRARPAVAAESVRREWRCRRDARGAGRRLPGRHRQRRVSRQLSGVWSWWCARPVSVANAV